MKRDNKKKNTHKTTSKMTLNKQNVKYKYEWFLIDKFCLGSHGQKKWTSQLATQITQSISSKQKQNNYKLYLAYVKCTYYKYIHSKWSRYGAACTALQHQSDRE